ncbi:MAG TPA: WD40 repeat domain-containing protein, partial [Mycobacteriales bacterium]|nr:WD40 repeat domain-containing protein [Mycobacteriales bacterium]
MPLAVRCRPIAAPLRRAVTLVAATSLAVGTAVLAAPAAQAADTVTPLPGVAGVADVATGGGRILVAAVDRLVIADSAGTVTGSLTLPGAYGIAPIPGTSRAYVSLRDTNQVAEVDVARRRIVRRIDLGATHPCPSEVVLSGGRVWVGYGCGSWGGGVLSVDAAAKTPVPVEVETGLYGAPSLAVANNVLAYGERGLSPATARVRTVGVNGATTLRGTVPPNWGDASNLGDLALSPDGTLLVLAAGAPYRHVGYDTTTLAEVRSYGDFDPYPNSVAFSPDGRQLAAGRNGEPEVTVYDTATATARAEGNVTYPLELVPATLAFSGADVVGAVRNWSANTYFLWMVKGATLPGSAIAVTAPEGGGTALEPLTLTGRLTGADGSPLGAQQLTVTRQQEATGAAVALPAVTTAAD